MQTHQRAFELGAAAPSGSPTMAACACTRSTTMPPRPHSRNPRNSTRRMQPCCRARRSARCRRATSAPPVLYCRRALDRRRCYRARRRWPTYWTIACGGSSRGARAVAESAETKLVDRITASYSLVDCLDAEDRIDEAFAAYERANTLMREQARAENLLYDRGKASGIRRS